MHIGITGPISFDQLRPLLPKSVGPTPAGLGGTPVNNLIIELWNRGHTLSVFSLDEEVIEPIVITGERIKIYVGHYRARHRMRDLFRQEREYLATVIREDDVPFVHAHWEYEFGLAAIQSGKPHLITLHDSPFQILFQSRDFYRAGRLVMALLAFKKGQAFSAVSPYIRQDLALWISSEITVVPNMVPPYLFQWDRLAPRKLECETIASVANGWGRRKNPIVALRAFHELKKSEPCASLVMYGIDFGRNERANVWAQQNGLDRDVNFIGYLPYEQLHHSLIGCDLLVHTSLEEACPMVLLEATALGIPVVAGIKSGGVPWVLGSGNGGLLVDVTSARAVADGMLSLLQDRELASTLSARGRQYAWENFRPQVVADQYESLYRRVLERSRWN